MHQLTRADKLVLGQKWSSRSDFGVETWLQGPQKNQAVKNKPPNLFSLWPWTIVLIKNQTNVEILDGQFFKHVLRRKKIAQWVQAIKPCLVLPEPCSRLNWGWDRFLRPTKSTLVRTNFEQPLKVKRAHFLSPTGARAFSIEPRWAQAWQNFPWACFEPELYTNKSYNIRAWASSLGLITVSRKFCPVRSTSGSHKASSAVEENWTYLRPSSAAPSYRPGGWGTARFCGQVRCKKRFKRILPKLR